MTDHRYHRRRYLKRFLPGQQRRCSGLTLAKSAAREFVVVQPMDWNGRWLEFMIRISSRFREANRLGFWIGLPESAGEDVSA